VLLLCFGVGVPHLQYHFAAPFALSSQLVCINSTRKGIKYIQDGNRQVA